MLATRAARSSIPAELTGASAGAGHPSIQATQITSEAATAPETGAITQGEIAAEGSWELRSGCASASTFRVSPETSVASRSMVGGARLARPESGGGSMSSGLSSTIAAGSLFRAAEDYQIRHVPGSD